MATLTMDDHHAMHQAGWCVELHPDGFRLRKLPVTKAFKDDADVWLHVLDGALIRDPLALKVLDFLRANGPLEFQLVGQYAAIHRRTAIGEEGRRAA